jgi:hypothetical protein
VPREVARPKVGESSAADVVRESLQQVLHAWRLTVVAASRDGYYEELEAVRNGAAQTIPAEEAFPDWQKRLTAVRAQLR